MADTTPTPTPTPAPAPKTKVQRGDTNQEIVDELANAKAVAADRQRRQLARQTVRVCGGQVDVVRCGLGS